MKSLEPLWDATAIALDELPPLRTRVDRKYVVPVDSCADLLAALARTHRALEIDGRRAFRYETVYFDSPSLSAFRAQLQGRRRRYKTRSRLYADSGLQVFELKLKGPRGETVKHQMPYGTGDRVTPGARAFLAARLAEAYPGMPLPDLEPSVQTTYERTTLATDSERVTFDLGLSFDDGAAALDPAYAIVESKCERGLGEADRLVRRAGVKPVACSKYCVGVALTREGVRANELKWLLRRYFNAN